MSAASSKCLPDEVVFAFVHGELAAEALQGVEEHLNRCADCRSVVAETARFVFPTETAPGVPAQQAQPLAAGTRVSRYVIEGPIGVGAAGVVYGAHDPQLRRKIALKLMRPDHSHGPRVEALEARLLREARAMAQLSHPNVVTVYDVGTYEDQVFIVMELVEGETLDRWLARETRPWREIVRAFTEAGCGLAAAHAVQIVHRDFKPANVLVGSDGRVRVTDFGLAHPMDLAGDAEKEAEAKPASPLPHQSAALATWTATEAGGMAGTPVFMAPEQFLRRRPVARTDQFSFCVALYMALYGRHPFAEEGRANRTLAKLAEDVVGGRLHAPPAGTDVPSHVFDILSRGLAVDPERRFASMHELLGTLALPGTEPHAKSAALRRSAWVAAALAGVAMATWATVRALEPRSAGAGDVTLDRPDATMPIASTSVSAPDEPVARPDPEGDRSGELVSGHVEPAKTPPSPGRSAPRVDRKVRSTPPKAARKRYDDGLKDPF